MKSAEKIVMTLTAIAFALLLGSADAWLRYQRIMPHEEGESAQGWQRGRQNDRCIREAPLGQEANLHSLTYGTPNA